MLLAKRVSDDKGERSDTIETQDKRLRARAYEEDALIVGDTEDLSVSGDVDMFNRPALGQWLTPEMLERWDELWVTNQDRLSRSEPHFMAFVFKVIEWDKKILVLDDPEFTGQMLTPEGRAILHVKSLGPHKELERIKQRVRESHERRRYTKRWPGGVPPFGYVPIKRYLDGKTATYIELDESMVLVLHEMRRLMVEERQSFTGVANYLNSEGVLTARDRARLRKGKPVKARGGPVGVREQWSETSVKSLLTDEALLGYKKHKRQVMYGLDGKPIQIAEPVFTDDEWGTLQAAVDRRRVTTERRVNGTSPLYGVAHCGRCGAKATHKVTERNGVTYRYYQCGAWPKSKRCVGVSCRAEEVEEMVEIFFLQKHGADRVTKRVWVPGNNVSKEIKEIEGRIERLRRQDEDGDWEDDREGYRGRMKSLRQRKTELAALPVQKSGWVEQDQGTTYVELWSGLDLEGKRKQLIESGFKMMVGSKTTWLEKAPLDDRPDPSGDPDQ
ncbi:recombinase family protein [Streptomyces albulus]|nr:recombinase family protein [Streptomyces noursei]GGW89246.1 integrase [Streptomyces noursei]